MTFGSLFAGIGGFDLGLERAGMECRWQVELDPYCQRVLAKHWPHVPRWDDVRTFHCFTKGFGKVDVICGGFPCQDISKCGHRAGIDGDRSGLWREMFRVICQLRPSYVVVENVAALLQRGIERVLGDLAGIGFDAEWEIIPACAFAAPHMRKRLFIVSYAAGGGLQGRVPSERFNEAPRLGWNGEPSRVLSGAWNRWGNDRSDTRVADGFSNRVDRVKGLGNAVVPQVAEYIGRRIIAANGGY